MRINRSSLNTKRERGSAIIEFTIVAAFFFMVFFTIVDFSMYGYVKLTMQSAVREGARYAVTGRSDLDPDSNGDRAAAVIEKISQASNGYLDKVMDPTKIRVEDIDGNALAGFGSSGDVIAIHLDCEWDSFSPLISTLLEDGTYKFTVSTAMRNEAF
jgi:Flp pilus assembly protein TadG